MSYMCYKEVIKEKVEKEGKMSFSIFIFIYTIHLAYLKVYTKFENIGSYRSWEICDGSFHWRERKCTDKGTDKQYVAVFVTKYNLSLSSFVPNFRALSQVFAEKSLTEKSLQTNKQTNRQT